MNATQVKLIYKFSKPLNGVILKTLKYTGTTLMTVITVANSLLAQTTRAITQPDIDYTSYYQEYTTLFRGSDDLDIYSPASQIQHQEWSETFAVGMYPIPNSTKVRLNVEKKYGETVTVRLLNEDGKVLNEKWLNKRTNKFGCYFNFSPSQDGTFTIEITNGQEVIRKTIWLATPVRKIVALK